MSDDTNESRFNRRFLAYFAVGLCVVGLSFLFMITFLEVPEKNQRFADTALGFILATLLATPIGFFYGSSKSSQAKDDVIAQAMPTPPADK